MNKTAMFALSLLVAIVFIPDGGVIGVFYQHTNVASGRWHTMRLVERLTSVGSEVGRIHR